MGCCSCRYGKFVHMLVWMCGCVRMLVYSHLCLSCCVSCCVESNMWSPIMTLFQCWTPHPVHTVLHPLYTIPHHTHTAYHIPHCIPHPKTTHHTHTHHSVVGKWSDLSQHTLQQHRHVPGIFSSRFQAFMWILHLVLQKHTHGGHCRRAV